MSNIGGSAGFRNASPPMRQALSPTAAVEARSPELTVVDELESDDATAAADEPGIGSSTGAAEMPLTEPSPRTPLGMHPLTLAMNTLTVPTNLSYHLSASSAESSNLDTPSSPRTGTSNDSDAEGESFDSTRLTHEKKASFRSASVDPASPTGQALIVTRYHRAVRTFGEAGLEGGVTELFDCVDLVTQHGHPASLLFDKGRPELSAARAHALDCVLHLRLHQLLERSPEWLSKQVVKASSQSESFACRTSLNPLHALTFALHASSGGEPSDAQGRLSLAMLAAACEARYGSAPLALQRALLLLRTRTAAATQQARESLALLTLCAKLVTADSFVLAHDALLAALASDPAWSDPPVARAENDTAETPSAADIFHFHSALAAQLPGALAKDLARSETLAEAVRVQRGKVQAQPGLKPRQVLIDALDRLLAALPRAALDSPPRAERKTQAS